MADIHLIGAQLAFDFVQDFSQVVLQLLLGDDHRNAVDTAGEMFHIDVVSFQNTQQSLDVSNFGAHQVLVETDNGEVLGACDTGDNTAVIFRLCTGYDHGSGMFRIVGISDVDGDILTSYGVDGIFVQNAGAHVGQFAQFRIGNGADGVRVLYDAGVRL